EFVAGRGYTRFVEEHIAELVAPVHATHRRFFFDQTAPVSRAGAKIDTTDPLAVLAHGKADGGGLTAPEVTNSTAHAPLSAVERPENTVAIAAPLQGTIVSIDVREGDLVRKGQQLLIMESMKMEHVIEAQTSGVIRQLVVTKGDT